MSGVSQGQGDAMIYLQQHPKDENMIDIMTPYGGVDQSTWVWATVHSDLFYEIDRDGIYKKLKTGKRLQVELKEVPE